MKKINTGLLILICIIGAARVAVAEKGAAPVELKFGRELLEKTPTVEVVVNGKTRRFYFDSGGGVSAVSPEIAKEIGCTPLGGPAAFNAGGMKFTVKRCEDVEIKLGAFTVKRDFAVFDPMPFFPNAKGKIDGGLALDVFDNRAITIDLVGDRLWIENEKSLKKKIRDMKPLAARLSRGVAGSSLDVFVAAQTPRGKIWLLLDTGNTNKLLLTPSAQAQLGIDFNGANAEKIIKPVKLNIIGLGEIEADGREREMIYDGMLSYEVISRLIFTVDFRTGKMWAKLRN